MRYISCSLPVALSVFDVVACEDREDEVDSPNVDIMVRAVVVGGPAPKMFHIHPFSCRYHIFYKILHSASKMSDQRENATRLFTQSKMSHYAQKLRDNIRH